MEFKEDGKVFGLKGNEIMNVFCKGLKSTSIEKTLFRRVWKKLEKEQGRFTFLDLISEMTSHKAGGMSPSFWNDS